MLPFARQRERFNHNRLRLEALEPRHLLAAQSTVVPFDQLALDIDPDSYDADNILVRFRDEYQVAVASYPTVTNTILNGSSLGSRVGRIPGLHRVDLSQTGNIQDALAAYQNNPMVLYAEPNYRVRIADTIPNDFRFDDMYPLHNTGQTGGQVDADIDAPAAWDVSQGSGSTLLAVIDTGVDYLHPDLAANIWVNPGEIAGDQIDNDGNGYIDDLHGFDFANNDGDPMDDQGHGTHVAGTIGAVGNNGIGVTGINWNIQIMALKFLGADGSGTSEDAIEAIQYAVANGATISNNSWGGDPYSQAMRDAIAAADGAGHIFVTAAGNGNIFGIGQNNDAIPFYPASYDVDNIIAVAATDHNDHVAPFSNYGATSVDIAAPGLNILSTTLGGNYGLNSGTSMATPHVAGVTALVEDLNPAWNHDQVIQHVLNSAEPLTQLYGVVSTGGRLNVANAVGNPEPPPPTPPPGTLSIFENYEDGVADFLQPRVGAWDVSGGEYHATPMVQNQNLFAVSTADLTDPLPSSVNIQATVNADEGFLGFFGIVLSDHLTNGYVAFDYHGPDDFKFAGADMKNDRWMIGRRTASGWVADAILSQTLDAETDYALRVIIENDTDVTLLADGVVKATHQYASSVTDGDVGLAMRDSTTHFDNFLVEEHHVPTPSALPLVEDFDDDVADHFQEQSGVWYTTGGQYRLVPDKGDDGISTVLLSQALPDNVEIQTTVHAESVSGYYHNALVVFDYQSATDFKFAGAYVGGDRWVVGRRTSSGWVVDAELSETINSATDYYLQVAISNGTDVQLSVGGVTKVTHTYGDLLTDGTVGLATENAVARFDNFVVQDYVPPPPPPPGSLPFQEDFDNGTAESFDEKSGIWTATGDRYRVVPSLGSDAVSTIHITDPLPSDLEIQATINGESVSGYYHNALVVFDYQSNTDFKFAGAYVGGDRWVIGRRTASGWVEDAEISETINTAADYDVKVVLQGNDVQLLVNGIRRVSHAFGDLLTDGAVGLGTQNAVAQYDDVVVQAYLPPPTSSLPLAEDFDDGVADFFDAESGLWSVTADRWRVVPNLGEDALSIIRLADPLPTDVDIQATLNGESVSGYYHNALVVFDYQSPTDFKFAGAYVGGNRWVIGRRTASGWVEDAEISETINSAADYDVRIILRGSDVELLVDDDSKVIHTFADTLNDGGIGLGTQNAVAQFDDVLVQAYVPPPTAPLPFLEDFDDGVADFFDSESGTWTVTGDRYRVVPDSGSDAVSTIRTEPLPADYRILATVHGESVSGYYHNALVVFDYQSETDFKFAGAYVGGNRWVVGHRTAGGWVEDADFSETINTAADYDLQIVISGNDVELLVGGVSKVTHSFGDVLSDGAVGLSTQNAVAQYDNVMVQAYSPGPLPYAEDFDDGIADFFVSRSGVWTPTGDRFRVVPVQGNDAISTIQIGEPLPSDFEFQATLNGESVSGYYHNALMVFDYQSDTNFKFAGAYVGGNRWVMGRRTSSGWTVDAQLSETINTSTDYDVQIVISGSDAELLVGGVSKVSHTFGDSLNDGDVGLATQNAVAQYDDVIVQSLAISTQAGVPVPDLERTVNEGQEQTESRLFPIDEIFARDLPQLDRWVELAEHEQDDTFTLRDSRKLNSRDSRADLVDALFQEL